MPRAMAIESFERDLQLVVQPEPKLPPGHALLQIEACGVCHSDVKTSRGLMPWSSDLKLPHIPGHEICGRVLRTNPPGKVPSETLVLVHHFGACGRCSACTAGMPNICEQPTFFCGFTTPGGFQDLLAVPLDQIVALAPDTNPVEAAPIACAVATAYRAVIPRGQVRAGDRVLVIGLGGVGLSAMQVAEAVGATAVGLDRSSEAVRRAAELGLRAHVSNDAGFGFDLARDVTPNVTIDAVGSEETLKLASEVAAPGGRVVIVGYGVGTMLKVPTPSVVGRELHFLGSRAASISDLTGAVDLVASGRVRPIVSQVLPLEAANEAVDALERHSTSGRIVLDVSGSAVSGAPGVL